MFCARPRPAPFARALTATERGQLPSHVDVEMLRGPNYSKGGRKVWPQPFADWASRWSKRGAGDAPAIEETNVGSATATAAARAAVAELLRAVAAHPSRLRVSGRAHTCARASPPRLARVRVVSALRTAPSCARRLASSPRVIVSHHHLWRHRRGARSAGARSVGARAAAGAASVARVGVGRMRSTCDDGLGIRASVSGSERANGAVDEPCRSLCVQNSGGFIIWRAAYLRTGAPPKPPASQYDMIIPRSLGRAVST